MSTKFMDALFTKMKTVNRPDKEAITAPRADITVTQYMTRLKKLNDDKTFTSLTFLKDTDAINEKLGKLVASTRASYYNAIIIALATVASHKKLLNKYRESATGVWNSLSETAKSHEKNEKQTESIIAMEEVNKIKSELLDEVKVLIPKKKITEAEYNKYLQFVILSLYTDIPPRRNQDYACMVIRKTRPAEMDKEKNYFITSEKKFVFNKYKTASKYDKQEVDVPDMLVGTLFAYMKRHPLLDTVKKLRTYTEAPLLINYDGTEPNKVNFITRTLNKVFGKNIGATALRHIYLSDKYADTIMEQQKDASAMAHSVEEAKNYIKL